MKQRDILDKYAATKSMNETARKLKLSKQTVRRVLISNGIYPSERTKEVARLCLMGMTAKEIAEYLGISAKTVQANLPYSKGSYVTGAKSKNAERILKWRTRKKLGLLPIDKKPVLRSGYAENPIARARLAMGLTQKKLGELIGCGGDAVARWESGRRSPNPQNLKKLQEVLEIEMKEESHAQN